MINNIKKILKKIKKVKNIYSFFIKIGFQRNKFLNNNYLLKNCIIKTWIKILKRKKIFLFGYSNSLFISGIIKIIFKILNNNKKKNILIFFNFNFLKILKIKKKITNFKLESFKNIFNYIFNFIIYN
ncbi:SufE family protein [Candidatus Carsonella ruddii]|uniref:SufE family protein n=1 Tax=Carsonella ruddii TaxID=114186 RepID=A0AAJ6FQH6_CARRU|nr:SufE family protein [Candidatus Carsonella ruddii]WGS66575.1 SufE family protein [Candidatus Carsonella ruddii]WGS66964.1 SufE family protein [Candidatus Carsonella ruddii]WGS67156.1 SufE family protein [Candidatus Carsonella ruddii]WMC18171.1 MAG: SufE family protein [Candidatus Carsonella ruddii]WMC18365.1 MAG: SufE family protein [Candidatus Carsonella ruddii]